MKISRRIFLQLVAGAAALPALSPVTWGQSYPDRPVRIIVGFPGGSTSDILARLIGQWLAERLGHPFIIEDRPGASGNLATEAVVRAPPDGYTLLLIGSNHTINSTLFDNFNFNFIRDIAPIASVMRTPGVMEVNLSVPATTPATFIAYAKANPGKITMASGGNGTATHLYGEQFMLMTGIDMVHVPYRGSPLALTDLLSGQVQVMFDNLPTSLEHIRAGKLRALAVTSATRLDVLPDVPPLGDFVSGYEASLWQGVGAPKETPSVIVDRLNREINAALADSRIKARLSELGGVPLGGQGKDFAKLIANDTEKWARVIRAANIKPE